MSRPEWIPCRCVRDARYLSSSRVAHIYRCSIGHVQAVAMTEEELRETRQLEATRGAELRDAGMAQAEGAAPEEWKGLAAIALRDVRDRGPEFTSEDVRDLLEERGTGDPPEPRAMGPVMMAAHRRGYIEPSGAWTSSTRASSHRMPKRLWKSTGKVWA